MSGALVGKCLIEGGASCLKMLTCKRDKESASGLRIPGICLALKRISFFKQMNTNFRTKNIRDLSRHNYRTSKIQEPGKTLNLCQCNFFCNFFAVKKFGKE